MIWGQERGHHPGELLKAVDTPDLEPEPALKEAPGLRGNINSGEAFSGCIHSLWGHRALAGGCHITSPFTGGQERQLTQGATTTWGQEGTWLAPTTTPALCQRRQQRVSALTTTRPPPPLLKEIFLRPPST